MRQIKASEVRPGMTIRWERDGIMYESKVAKVTPGVTFGLFMRSPEGGEAYIRTYTDVTVLSEPQPEEPTVFGARVVVGEEPYVRADNVMGVWRGLHGWSDWEHLCSLGQVTVIDADPSWTVPEPAPVVPDRIEEWPEDDEHLRGDRWRDCDGDPWYSVSDPKNRWAVKFPDRTGAFHPRPLRGPWTRVAAS